MIRSDPDFFRQLLESMPDGLWVSDNNHRIIYANRAMASIAGVACEELMGKSVLDDFPDNTLHSFREHYQDAVQSRQRRQYDCPVVTPACYVPLSFRPFDPSHSRLRRLVCPALSAV